MAKRPNKPPKSRDVLTVRRKGTEDTTTVSSGIKVEVHNRIHLGYDAKRHKEGEGDELTRHLSPLARRRLGLDPFKFQRMAATQAAKVKRELSEQERLADEREQAELVFGSPRA